jgi:hypothetical protein
VVDNTHEEYLVNDFKDVDFHFYMGPVSNVPLYVDGLDKQQQWDLEMSFHDQWNVDENELSQEVYRQVIHSEFIAGHVDVFRQN